MNTEAIMVNAIRKAFPKMPKIFYSTDFVKEVHRTPIFTGEPKAGIFFARKKYCQSHDGTILRHLRKFRASDPKNFGYRVIDHNKGIYEKI